MPRVALLICLALLGCRRASAPPPPRPVTPPSRPAEVIAWAELPALRGFAQSLHRAGVVSAAGTSAFIAALGIDEPSLSALDPALGASVAWTSAGVTVALPMRSAAALESALGPSARLREELDLGAWIERSGDAGARPACLLRTSPSPRLLCGGDRDALRRLAPWLASQAGAADEAAHLHVRDGAPGAVLRTAVDALSDWLAAEASRARAARGAPSAGDPEPIIDALRAQGPSLQAWADGLRGVRAVVRAVDDGLRVELEASGGQRARVGDAPLTMEVPSRGLAWAWRGSPVALRDALDGVAALTGRVLGARTPHAAAVRADLARWSRHATGRVSGSLGWASRETALTLAVEMDAVPSALQVASEMRAAPWWPAGDEVTVRGDARVLRVERGRSERANATVRGDAVAAAVLRLGDEVRDGLTVQVWRRDARVGVRVFLGAAWVRLATDARDR